MRAAVAALSLIACLAACDEAAAPVPDAATTEDAASPDRPALCARPGDDPVRDVFCQGDAQISSLQELLVHFKLSPETFDPDALDAIQMLDPSRHVALLGHSTALSGRYTSPINPRLILLGPDVIATFQRGVQQVELVTRLRVDSRLTFYLLSFKQACNATDGGCSPGALYTEAIEHDWVDLELADDEELKNTPSDCRQCHQRGTDTPQLLMRELESPWTHFFFPASAESIAPGENGSALMRDYVAAKGDELYGGVDLAMTTALSVFNLESIVGREQPLLFDAPKIESERWPWTAETGYSMTIQESATWEDAYEAFKRGEQLALPYVELRATDPEKQAALTEAYQRYLSGELDAKDLPDLGDIYPDDPSVRARIGLDTEPDATPAEALVQACAQCHNDVLDQSISRARFSVALGRMNREQLDRAVERIELPRDAPGAMPPPEARQLAPAARERLLDYLKSEIDPDAIDPMLERTAVGGMMGGAATRDPAGVGTP